MTAEDSTSHAASSPLDGTVRPRAWALFAPNGNYRIWSTVREEVERVAAEAGAPVTPLYDQAALDASVAAERERCAALCRRVADETRNSDDARAAGRMLANWISTGDPSDTGPNVRVQPRSAAQQEQR